MRLQQGRWMGASTAPLSRKGASDARHGGRSGRTTRQRHRLGVCQRPHQRHAAFTARLALEPFSSVLRCRHARRAGGARAV